MLPNITFSFAPVALGTLEKLLFKVSFPNITKAIASFASDDKPMSS